MCFGLPHPLLLSEGLLHSPEVTEFTPKVALFYSLNQGHFCLQRNSLWWWRAIGMLDFFLTSGLSLKADHFYNRGELDARSKSCQKAELDPLTRLFSVRRRSWWWRWLCLCSPPYLQSMAGEKKYKLRDSCFPESNNKTQFICLQFQSSLQAAFCPESFLSFLALTPFPVVPWWLLGFLAPHCHYTWCLLLHEALLSLKHRLQAGSSANPLLKHSWTFTSVYPKESCKLFIFPFAYISTKELPASRHRSTNTHFSFWKLGWAQGSTTGFLVGVEHGFSVGQEVFRTKLIEESIITGLKEPPRKIAL